MLMAAHSSHNDLSIHYILSYSFTFTIISFLNKKKVIVCAFHLLSLRTKQSFAICRVNIVPPAQTIKKKQKRKMKIDAPMYSMDRVKFPFNFLTALLLSKHVLRFLLRFPLTFKPSEL